MVMDRKLLYTVLALALVTIGTVVVVSRGTAPDTVPLNESVPGVSAPAEDEISAEESSASEDYAYIIREHEGRVAVFSRDNEAEPELVYDTLVKYLPDYDRYQLQEGIPVEDYAQLIALIEDFVS